MKLSVTELREIVSRRPALALLNPDLRIITPKASISPANAPNLTASMPLGQKRHRTAPRPKTGPEKAMALILEARKRKGEIESYVFEGATFIIGDGTRFTPDFCVTLPDKKLLLIEVKGPYIREDGLLKFKVAKMHLKFAELEMWQLEKGSWRRLL